MKFLLGELIAVTIIWLSITLSATSPDWSAWQRLFITTTGVLCRR